MKAAAVAAERGHDVTLFEASGRLGGQVKLAQLLPDRAEFGGLIPNLEREMELAGVTVVRNTRVDAALIASQAPEAVIVATGARPFRSPLEGAEEAHVVDAWQVLENQANVGAAVVIADWRCDWIGLGLAEKLTLEGSSVRLCANGYMPGWTIPQYVRDSWLGKLHKLGVEIIPLVRLAGADAESVYFTAHGVGRGGDLRKCRYPGPQPGPPIAAGARRSAGRFSGPGAPHRRLRGAADGRGGGARGPQGGGRRLIPVRTVANLSRARAPSVRSIRSRHVPKALASSIGARDHEEFDRGGERHAKNNHR